MQGNETRRAAGAFGPMEKSRDHLAQDAAVEDVRILAQRLRRQLAEMRGMEGADGQPLFSPHMLRLAGDSLDAAERYAVASRSKGKA